MLVVNLSSREDTAPKSSLESLTPEITKGSEEQQRGFKLVQTSRGLVLGYFTETVKLSRTKPNNIPHWKVKISGHELYFDLFM